MREQKWSKRDKARHKKYQGMVVSGAWVKLTQEILIKKGQKAREERQKP